MQNLEVISINFWQMLVSLANLLILFLILKKFLYAPVLKALEQRRSEVDGQYAAAAEAERSALAAKTEYSAKLADAEKMADEMRTAAVDEAKRSGERIVAEARIKADGMIRQAESQIELSQKKAEAEMKREIADVSTKLAEKLIERELDADAHRELIDSFIDKMGDKA